MALTTRICMQPAGHCSIRMIRRRSSHGQKRRSFRRNSNGKELDRCPMSFLSRGWCASEIAGCFTMAEPTSMLALLSPLSLETDHGQENIYQTLLGRDDRPRDFTAVHFGVRRKTEQLGGKRRIRHGELYKATTVEQIQQFVRKQNKLKVLGTRHCFNRIADSNNQFISVREINHVLSADPEDRTATYAGGIPPGW